MKPIQCHRRVTGGLPTLINPGDFFWTYTKDDDKHPIKLWYKNPHGDIGSITIKSNKREGWDWDRNLDSPTIKPSIFENPPNGWHGFITNGMMITCGR